MSDQLTAAQAADIADRVVLRQARFSEDLHTSMMVVLLNYGDQFTSVRCVRGEWSGTKADIPRSPDPSDLPHCPNGHVLLEGSSGRKALGVVDEEPILPPFNGGPAGSDRFA